MISRLINLRYEVVERTGEGTFFQVYKARDKVMNRVVAVKVLQSVYANDADFRDALRKAVTEAASLQHPNIARIIEYGEDEGQPFVVTEFVRGINLKERIRRIAPFTLSVAVDFAIAVGEALHSAHSQGQVHGDLRPQNVVISPEGAVKVTDFGMAGVLAVSQQAMAGNLGRAVHYQAPELAEGRPPSITTDLYALGVILFEMLTGGLPYPGETPLLVARKHQSDPVPSPRMLNPGVPRSLEGIVMKALQKRPEDRYRIAADFLNDLKSVRDALRFGKPLSWSPMEAPVSGAAAAAVSEPEPGRRGGGDRGRKAALEADVAAAPPAAPAPAPPVPRPTPEADPIPAGAARMSATSAADDRVSPLLKFLLFLVTGVIVIGGILITAQWMTTFSQPPDRIFPNLIGKRYDEAQRLAEQFNLRLKRQEEFNEKYEPEVIYRTEPETGRAIRQGRMIIVWVSKGSHMVWVPNVVNQPAREAEIKLKEAGLFLGTVNRAYSSKYNYDYVATQNPRAGKRVKRGQAVNLIVSDGPKPDEEPVIPDAGPGLDGATGGANNPDGDAQFTGPDVAGENDTITQTLIITIKRDGDGRRRVRVEYEDALGSHTPIDEYHDEGDEIRQKVDVTGPKLTLRVYYGEEGRLVREQTLANRRTRR